MSLLNKLNKMENSFDLKSLEFHIENNGYLATLANLINFMNQDMAVNGFQKDHEMVFGKIVGELMYLQENFFIYK